MKNFNKHEFDEIFRAGLSAPDLSEVDEDWALMKARLTASERQRAIPYYVALITSVAAIMLLVFSVLFNSPETAEVQANAGEKNDQSTSDLQLKAAVSNVSNIEPKSDLTGSTLREMPLIVTFDQIRPVLQDDEIIETSAEIVSVNDVQPMTSDSLMSVGLASATIAETSEPEKTLAAATTISPETGNTTLITNAVTIEDKNPTEPSTSITRSRFSLSVNFAPDLSGVEQFQNNHLDYSIGAGAIYTISNKLSIEAGATYGKKTYQTGFSSFRPASYNLFQVKPNIVSSGFDVMDIQLNMAYTLLKKGKSSVGLGAGISSYLMLDETYSFTYQNINARGLSSFSTGYQNNHFFGIANLYLTYKRNISNNVKLAFNPYMKLPLTDLGYGNIRLRSAGMSVGLITNLNKSKK